MEFQGRVYKTKGKPAWVIESSVLGVITQGYTKKEALFMLKDAIEELLYSYFHKRGHVNVIEHTNGIVGIASSDPKLLLSLALIQQRSESGLSVRQVAGRLGASSPNAYGKYERGRINISFEKFDELIKAVNPDSSGLIVNISHDLL